MNPTKGDVHVNAPLTNMSFLQMQSADGFVADKVFPPLPVSKQSDIFYRYDSGDFARDNMEERADGTESSGSGYDVDATPTYYCKVHSHHKDVSDRMRANADSQFQLDKEANIFLTQKALLRKEVSFNNRFMKSGVWGQDYAGVASPSNSNEVRKFSDLASDPIVMVRDGCRRVLERTGHKPNKAVFGKAAYDALLDHPDIIDRIKAGQTPNGPAIANRVLLAALFELDEVHVMEAIVNTAAKGATNAMAFINGANLLLTHAAKSPGLMTASGGYTFSWNGYLGANALGGRIKTFRMENLSSDRHEIELAFDQKVVGPDLGALYTGLV
jgi:hypothetical protein